MGDAALVRSVLAAHDIEVLISGENHQSVLGGLLGPAVALDIWVDESQAEEAATLLDHIRSGDGVEATDEMVEAAARESAGDGDDAQWPGSRRADAGSDIANDDDDEAHEPVQRRVDRRRSTGIVLLLGCCITFGTAHMFTRAWLRGVVLAALEVVGFVQLTSDRGLGALLIAAAVASDVIGALWRVWSAQESVVPVARIHK